MLNLSSTMTIQTLRRIMFIALGGQPAAPTKEQPIPSSPLGTFGRLVIWSGFLRRLDRPSTPNFCSWWTQAVGEVEVEGCAIVATTRAQITPT